MNAEQRIRMIRIIEKMKGKEKLCSRLGISEESHFLINAEYLKGEEEDAHVVCPIGDTSGIFPDMVHRKTYT